MIRSTLYTLLTLLTLTQCTITTEPIVYGTDGCHSCRMTIVDQQHAAQIVTKKGRNYKFDTIECMVRSLDQWQADEIGTYLISDYDMPATMINALTANYLISPAIPSPMGAFLSGFSSESNRAVYVKTAEDKAMNWEEMKNIIGK